MSAPKRLFPLALAAVAVVAVSVALSSVLGLIDRVVTLWERAKAVSPVAEWVLILVLLAAVLLLGGLLAWLLWPSKPTDGQSSSSIRSRVDTAAAEGINVAAAQQELATLEQRQVSGKFYIALFGHISSGKSSLINALAPGCSAQSAATGGTTTTVTHYDWVTAGGDAAIIADVPGSQDSAALSETATAEARRAHLVIYVCDGDLTASQWDDLQALMAWGKPLIVALNKQDQYAEDELDSLRTHIAERFAQAQRPPVVPCSAARREPVVLTDADGHSREVVRDRPASVDALRDAINTALRDDPLALTSLRDHAVFELAEQQLNQAQREHRRAAADQLVARHTRAAVVGALAAISPGSDLVIQGVIGAKLVRDLCSLFEVRVRDVDTDALLKAAGSRARNSSALVLAVAGNGLKAFPGIGTVSGGLTHAVAYGLLFDAFGRALVRTLIDQGHLNQQQAMANLDTALGEPLPARARRIAALALDIAGKPRD